ncbi:TonB-dependent receptor [Catenovulum sp. SM1970]|uniref:TonB-dependent receptor n=1 Tax=Marinifaba aquimaris TaxID=2741323 RepID=UPI001571D6B4|nr:TonB-dependent receptor [Marinifaba aquimaris]NTS77245.1 TonB-dependent receptor [Marinifaba aquimaris]
MKPMKISKIALGLACAMQSPFVMADDDVEKIENIVVYGQKIDRSLHETANSVGIVSGKDIEVQNIQNINDLYTLVPNISGDLNQGFSIRGINYSNVSGGGTGVLTSIYVDGAPMPFRVVKMGTQSVWDLAQVEVFRGAQSTMQGQNSLAGAIMLRTQDPTYEWGGKAKITLGENGQQEFAIAGGGELVEDKLAFRVSLEDKNLDGDIENITRNEKSNDQDGQTARFKLLFEPSDDFSALLTVNSTDHEVGFQYVQYNFGEDPFDRKTQFNSDIWEKTETDIFNLELDWQITPNLSVQSITTYNDSDYSYNWDGDMQPTTITADNAYVTTSETVSQELRLVYENDELELVSGIYYSELDLKDDKATGERLITFAGLGLPPIDVLLTAPAEMGGFGLPAEIAAMVVPLYPDIDPVKLGFETSQEQGSETMAIYADMKWSINEQWDLLAGLRHDQEEQENGNSSVYSINNQLPNAADFPTPINAIIQGINGRLVGLASAATSTIVPESEDFDAWLPKLGVTYNVSEDLNASFVFQKAYRSGGVGYNTAKGYNYSYEPEYTNNYEFSLRSVWLDGELMLNTNVYFIDWTDQQISVQGDAGNFDTEVVNSGESELKGFEIEAFYYPTNQLSIVAGIGYADTEFKKFEYVAADGSIKDYAGQAFTDSPELTANLTANYEFDSGLFANLAASYVDSSRAYLDPELSLQPSQYEPNPENDARFIINTAVGYVWDDKYTIRLDVKNLLDDEYISTYFNNPDDLGMMTSYGQHQLGSARQASLSITAEF